MTIRRNSQIFPFSRVNRDDEPSQRRQEIEDAISFLERQLDEVVDQVNAELAQSAEADSTDETLAEISSQLASISINLTAVQASLDALQDFAFTIPEVSKILTKNNITPLQLSNYFSDSVTIPNNWTGFVPDGFENDGEIVIEGTLRTI